MLERSFVRWRYLYDGPLSPAACYAEEKDDSHQMQRAPIFHLIKVEKVRRTKYYTEPFRISRSYSVLYLSYFQNAKNDGEDHSPSLNKNPRATAVIASVAPCAKLLSLVSASSPKLRETLAAIFFGFLIGLCLKKKGELYSS